VDHFRDGLRGSRAYARRHAGEVGEVILLDYVGARGLRLPREGSSDRALWARLRAAAARVGVSEAFPDETGTTVYDDHTPFLERGVPAIDLIDFQYPWRDTLADDLTKVSPRSLDVAGEAVFELVDELRRR
jgi:Zn-dependent M28 family amino/carboxypeptidase